jgi:two-component system chemotaxis sensor kinase CheA
VGEKAAAHGLPHATHQDLVEALFTDGLSTAQAVTEISGRGVGLGAVRATVARLGGRLTLTSVPGEGTSWTFSFSTALEDVSTAVARGTDVASTAGSFPALERHS